MIFNKLVLMVLFTKYKSLSLFNKLLIKKNLRYFNLIYKNML